MASADPERKNRSPENSDVSIFISTSSIVPLSPEVPKIRPARRRLFRMAIRDDPPPIRMAFARGRSNSEFSARSDAPSRSSTTASSAAGCVPEPDTSARKWQSSNSILPPSARKRGCPRSEAFTTASTPTSRSRDRTRMPVLLAMTFVMTGRFSGEEATRVRLRSAASSRPSTVTGYSPGRTITSPSFAALRVSRKFGQAPSRSSMKKARS